MRAPPHPRRSGRSLRPAVSAGSLAGTTNEAPPSGRPMGQPSPSQQISDHHSFLKYSTALPVHPSPKAGPRIAFMGPMSASWSISISFVSLSFGPGCYRSRGKTSARVVPHDPPRYSPDGVDHADRCVDLGLHQFDARALLGCRPDTGVVPCVGQQRPTMLQTTKAKRWDFGGLRRDKPALDAVQPVAFHVD
jgi:hypothetical protein